MTRILSYAFGTFILISAFSCATDDTKSTGDDDPLANVVISSKIGTSTNIPVDPANDSFTTVETTPLDANKFTETTREFYTNDVLTTTSVYTEYLYNGAGFLTNQNNAGVTFSREYFYDANNTVIAANLYLDNGVVNNYRFLSQPDNVFFHERISEPYTDPAADILQRIIIKLNDDEQVITAGLDADLDGVIDSDNTFTYDVTGNLMTATNATETITIAYTDIIDTENFIQQKMLGIKNLSIINGEAFGMFITSQFDRCSASYNLSTQVAAEATIEVNTANFYTKITYPEDPHGDFINTRTVEYLFAN